MDAEGIFYAVTAIANWRAMLALVTASAAAWLLVFAVPLLNGVQGFLLGVSGLLIGLIWQEHKSLVSSPNRPDEQTRPSVAAACSAFLAFCWGLASCESFQSAATGAFIMGLTLLAHTLYYRRVNLISTNRALLHFYSAILGYAAAAVARMFIV